jgi:hypothetical protein
MVTVQFGGITQEYKWMDTHFMAIWRGSTVSQNSNQNLRSGTLLENISENFCEYQLKMTSPGTVYA